MAYGFDELVMYVEKLPEQIVTGNRFSLSMKKNGENLIIVVPNLGTITCHQDKLKQFGAGANLPMSLPELIDLLQNERCHAPTDFFRRSLSALAIGHGYGSVKLECCNPRSFIGTVGFSYKGIQKKS